jgi:hypothetical protein
MGMWNGCGLLEIRSNDRISCGKRDQILYKITNWLTT